MPKTNQSGEGVIPRNKPGAELRLRKRKRVHPATQLVAYGRFYTAITNATWVEPTLRNAGHWRLCKKALGLNTPLFHRNGVFFIATGHDRKPIDTGIALILPEPPEGVKSNVGAWRCSSLRAGVISRLRTRTGSPGPGGDTGPSGGPPGGPSAKLSNTKGS